MIVAVTGSGVGLIAVNAAILPVPAAASPILVLLLVQLYTIVPPVVGLVKFTAAVRVLLHTVWLAGGVTVAVGFTVIVNVLGVPLQPLADGVTVIVATSGAFVALVATKLPILPVPLAARPIAGVLLVQL